MPDNHDFRLGVYSGLLAVIMVVALAVMAFLALEPATMEVAENHVVVPEQPHQLTP